VFSILNYTSVVIIAIFNYASFNRKVKYFKQAVFLLEVRTVWY